MLNLIILYSVELKKMLPLLEHEIKLKECVLTRVNCTKYLGICIDEHLLWRHHVNSLTSKLSKYIPVIFKIRSQIDKNSLKLLYNSCAVCTCINILLLGMIGLLFIIYIYIYIYGLSRVLLQRTFFITIGFV